MRRNLSQNAPRVQIVQLMPKRVTVRDTDTGKKLIRQIEELQDLLAAYRTGSLKECL